MVYALCLDTPPILDQVRLLDYVMKNNEKECHFPEPIHTLHAYWKHSQRQPKTKNK